MSCSKVITFALLMGFNVALSQEMMLDPKMKAKIGDITDTICKGDFPAEKAKKLVDCEDAPKMVSEILKKCRAEAKIPEEPKMRLAHFCASMKEKKVSKVEMKDTKDVKKEQGKEGAAAGGEGGGGGKEGGKEKGKDGGKEEKKEPKKEGQGEVGKKKAKRSPGEMMPMAECIKREKGKSPATKEALDLFVKNKTSPDGQKALVACIEKAMA